MKRGSRVLGVSTNRRWVEVRSWRHRWLAETPLVED
uniref:Uncharacterized protein MANES_16G008200 n=1 Tax=Rhizophora mucronata TaxID=61149 RepID=A0A2P2NR75_RHIMU